MSARGEAIGARQHNYPVGESPFVHTAFLVKLGVSRASRHATLHDVTTLSSIRTVVLRINCLTLHLRQQTSTNRRLSKFHANSIKPSNLHFPNSHFLNHHQSFHASFIKTPERHTATMRNSTSTTTTNGTHTNNTTSSSLILSSLISQANVIGAQAYSRQDFWNTFNICSEENLHNFEIARRLLISDSDFALKLLQITLEVAKQVDRDSGLLLAGKESQEFELEGLKRDVGMLKSVQEQKEQLDRAIKVFEHHAHMFEHHSSILSDKMTTIESQHSRIETLLADKAELEKKIGELKAEQEKKDKEALRLVQEEFLQCIEHC
ncbi:hypothetical protein E4T47_08992 [Aureobasidium subglaciale]|nr:hypothetical protein E4T47_08992 [Aureobasidium subglaciale]